MTTGPEFPDRQRLAAASMDIDLAAAGAAPGATYDAMIRDVVDPRSLIQFAGSRTGLWARSVRARPGERVVEVPTRLLLSVYLDAFLTGVRYAEAAGEPER